jgi:hypothetical protein
MATGLRTLAAAAGIVVTLAGPHATAAGIDCKKIGVAYDDLFLDVSKRIEAISAEFKALPAQGADAKRDAIRRRFCAVGGEMVGLYKFVRALANDCSTQGDKMGELIDVVNKQLGLAQQGIKEPCS